MKRWMKMTAAFVVAAAAMALGGCGESKYERIPIAEGTDVQGSQQEEAPVFVIGETSERSDVIVLEPGTAQKAAQGTGGRDGNPEGSGGEKADGQTEDGQVTLLFGGDVLLSEHVLNAYQKGGGIGGVLDGGYREVIDAADFFMVNQEFPFSNRGTAAEDKQYTFRLPPERVAMFLEMGIDGVSLANNHALDFGTDALLDSCDTLDGAGILHTGAGASLEEAKKPVIAEINGIRVGILGATRVIPEAGWAAGKNHPGMLATYDASATLEEIRRMRTECDYVAVFVHWGIEREERPQEYQRTLGQQYIDAGADLVVGSHPHVLQGIEYYKGKPIVYSLGNFVFGSSIPKTALLKVTLPEKGMEGEVGAGLQLIPGTSGAGYTRRLTDEGELHAFYEYIESISFGVSLDLQGIIVPGA